MAGEPNVKLFSCYRAVKVEMDGSSIKAASTLPDNQHFNEGGYNTNGHGIDRR